MISAETSFTLLKCMGVGCAVVFFFALWYVSVTEWKNKLKANKPTTFRKMRIFMDTEECREERLAVHYAMQFANYYACEGKNIEQMALDKNVSVERAEELVAYGNELLTGK